MRDLDEIAERQKKGKESEKELLFELEEAFDKATEQAGTLLSESVQALNDLLCDDDSELSLRDEPHVIRQVLLFAEINKIERLASILKDAPDGKPQPEISFFVTSFDQQKEPLDVEEPESCRFDGKNWGSTDIAMSMLIGDFEHELLQEMLPKREVLDLQAPLGGQDAAEEETIKEGVPPAIYWELAKEKRLSKIGGLPDVKPGFVWPKRKGVSLSFLAQFDLSELPSVPPTLEGLPQTGLLYFFYDKKQTTWRFNQGDRGNWSVLYEPDTADLQEATLPSDLTSEIYSELPATPCVVESFRGNEGTRHQMGEIPQRDSKRQRGGRIPAGVKLHQCRRHDQKKGQSAIFLKFGWFYSVIE